MARLQRLERVAGYEDVDPGLERGERPLSPKLHLHVDKEIPRTFNLSMQVHGASVGVQLPGAEVVLLVALRDADDDVVPRVGWGRSDAEDLGGDDDVGLEAEVVVGDSQGSVLTVQVVGTADPLTATTKGHGEGEAALLYLCSTFRHRGDSKFIALIAFQGEILKASDLRWIKKNTSLFQLAILTWATKTEQGRLHHSRVGHFAVVRRTAERKAAVPSLDVVAGLSQRAVVGPRGALINIYIKHTVNARGLVYCLQLRKSCVSHGTIGSSREKPRRLNCVGEKWVLVGGEKTAQVKK